MAGYENIKDKGFDKRTTGELREIAKKGGKASGEVRRRKADFRKTLNLLLTAEIDNEVWKPVLESLGVECDEVPPVPIPNTVVKLIYVENTWRVTAREDR